MRADKVVTDLGMTKGVLYHYFATKLELGYAILDERIGPESRHAWRTFEQATERHLDALVACLQHFVKRLDEEEARLGNPLNNLIQEMTPLNEGFNIRLQGIVGEMHKSLVTGMRNGQATGTVSPSIDPGQTAWFVLACVEGSYGMAKVTQSPRVFEGSVNQLITYLRTLAG